MSWSKLKPLGTSVAWICAATLSVMLESCAEGPLFGSHAPKVPNPTYDTKALTPLGQYRAVPEELSGQLALAPHPQGRLSDAQKTALNTLTAKVAAAGEGAFTIKIGSLDIESSDAATTAQAAADQLRTLGVAQDRISFARYEAPQPGGPVQISYSVIAAVGPNCTKGWDDVSATRDNLVTRHFGCATAANLAAMISDPRDLQRPAPATSADATRRIEALAKYRKGENTSSAKDEQSSGAVSQTVR